MYLFSVSYFNKCPTQTNDRFGVANVIFVSVLRNASFT